jgi:hypothetical protein
VWGIVKRRAGGLGYGPGKARAGKLEDVSGERHWAADRSGRKRYLALCGGRNPEPWFTAENSKPKFMSVIMMAEFAAEYPRFIYLRTLFQSLILANGKIEPFSRLLHMCAHLTCSSR